MRVQTAHPIAATSVDHLHPRGTKNDNSTNLQFNARLFDLLKPRRPMVLDLGCSGGGFVASVIGTGGFAVGIEGSDYSRREGRAFWPTLDGERLFTADIGQPFLLLSEENIIFSRFNVVTAWEVLEHLSLDELETLNLNMHVHLGHGGYFIGSVNSAQDRFEGVDYHVSVYPPDWWLAFFSTRGWIPRLDLVEHFDSNWVRGPNTDGASSSCFVFEKP